jgi:hypothetical protein
MGRDPLKKFMETCPHPARAMQKIWEDHILMGPIYYGERCTQCGTNFYQERGPLDLGVYV